ncbi:MAG: hypothetical protein AB7F59_13920 [Bdellovibrionales bacterium]
MEKRLIVSIILILIGEVVWLLADMKIISISGITQESVAVSRQLIGEVEDRHYSLKRRYLNSLVWEDTKKAEPLYLYDSVLTLERSSAVLKLHGNTQLKLSENTLVVLEPSTRDGVDQLKIRFSRGDVRSRNPDKSVAVAALTWTVEIQQGSEVQLRTKDEKQLEVEVVKGQVKVQDEKKSVAKEYSTGDLVRMNEDQVEHQRLTQEIQWKTPISDLQLVRRYAHHFPIEVRIEWVGSAKELIWENPLGKIESLPLTPEQTNQSLDLIKGLHHFRLKNSQGTTAALPVEIWQAPSIHTFWPLPRDRYTAGQPVMFSWAPVDEVKKYRLVLKDVDRQTTAFEKTYEKQNLSHESVDTNGAFEWMIAGEDSLGFAIPHTYTTPVFFLTNPLAPPVLRTPEIRKPAQKESPRSSSLQIWKILREWILPSAHAEKTRENLKDIEETSAPPADYQAVFQWEVVTGAAHYVIEIDSEPDFKTPITIQKVSKPEFIWSEFSLGKYYWRVAAGGAKGEMGLFSPVTPVDLRDPKVFDQRLQPTVVIATPPPVKKPPKEEVDLNREPPPAVVKKVDSEAEKVRFIKGFVHFVPTGEQTTVQSDSFKAQFRGYYLMSARAQLDIPWNEVEDLSFRFSYRQADFKPQPESEYPFQEKLNRQQVAITALYGQVAAWQYGVKAVTLQTLKRQSFESLVSESTFGYGPSVSLPLATKPWLSQLDLWILLGSQIWSTGVEASLGYETSLSSNIGLQYGGSVELQYSSTSTQKETMILPKVFMGLGW